MSLTGSRYDGVDHPAGPPRPEDDRTRLDVADRLFGSVADVDVASREPASVGRYQLRRKLGAGAMGVVWAAFDPRLRREVAIKILKASLSDELAVQRLRREAKAMARINHPNVVVVTDVGRCDDGGPFLAMELVRGTTLAHWLRQRQRTRAEILAVFDGAGRGLAAAHAAGVVHRDFKPDNMMVDDRDQARVLDLGLSAALASPTAAASSSAVATEVSSFIGTPAYASPEQFEQLSADARSDQFSFCVALYEALCGTRPFPGRTFAELAVAVTTGEPIRPPARAIPRGLWAVLRRGLARKVEDRWPDIPTLLQALRRHSRVRAVLPVVAVVAVAVAVAWPATRPSACDGEQAAAELWSARRRALLPAVGEESIALLDARLAAWVRAYEAACADAKGGALTRRCLDTQLSTIDVALGRLEQGTPDEQLRTADLAEALPWPGGCSTPTAEMTPGLARRIAEVRAAQALGRDADVLEEARAIAAQAAAQGDGRAAALALGAQGSILENLGHYREARDVLDEALWSRRDDLDAAEVARVALRLTSVLTRLGELSRARTVLDLAIEAGSSTGDPRLPAAIAVAECRMFDQSGAFDRAIEACERAVTLARPTELEQPIQLSVAIASLAMPKFRTGQREEADALFEEAAQLVERRFGPEHPRALALRCQLASSALEAGRSERGRQLARGVVDTVTQRFSTTHPLAACGHTNLGTYHHLAGRPAEAREHWHRAADAHLATLGFDNIFNAAHYSNIANTYVVEERWPEALENFEQAHRIRERALGPDHPENAFALVGIGQVHVSMRRPETAIPPLRRALELYGRHGTDPLRLGIAHWYLARALWNSTRDWEATVHSHVALDLFARAGAPGQPWVRELLEGLRRAPPPRSGSG